MHRGRHQKRHRAGRAVRGIAGVKDAVRDRGERSSGQLQVGSMRELEAGCAHAAAGVGWPKIENFAASLTAALERGGDMVGR